MTRLRNYQKELVDQTAAALRKHRSVLLQSPTGSGKTEMAVEIARTYGSKVIWFVCHRREILTQTSDALKAAGVSDHGIISPLYKEQPGITIQVCSIDALRFRYKRFPTPDLIILDECHHVAAEGWAKLIKRFPDAKLLGLTATPERLDGRGLEEWFEHMIVGPGTSELIKGGFLSKFRMFAPSIPDLRGVGITRGDYDPAALESKMDKPAVVGDAIAHYKRLTPNARALAFAVSIRASKALVAQFKAAGIPAKHVDWSTPKDQRDKAKADLAAGVIRVLSNREIFTEGFDLPAIDAVILLRPTRSFALYRQMIGRSLRAVKGKADTVILDHAGAVFEHDLPDAEVAWSLEGRQGGVAKQHRLSGMRRCPECGAIHNWSPTCPECNYVYKLKDRTVEQIIGELYEITKLEPALYETQERFARRYKVSPHVIRRWVDERGMPTHGQRRLIKIEEGLAWVKENIESADGYESVKAFALRTGYTVTSISRFIREGGLPAVKSKTPGTKSLKGLRIAGVAVHIENGLQWVRDNCSDATKPPIGLDPAKYETPEKFCARIGCSRATFQQRLVKLDLPRAKNGWVCIEDALQRLRREGILDEDGKYIPTKERIPTGFASKTVFAQKIGKSRETIRNWIKEGLPVDDRGLIPIEEATRWVAENISQQEEKEAWPTNMVTSFTKPTAARNLEP